MSSEPRVSGELEFRYLEKDNQKTLQIRRVIESNGYYMGNIPNYTTRFTKWKNVPVVMNEEDK